MSALTTATSLEIARVIQALEEDGFRDRVKVMVGGGAVTRAQARDLGANGYHATARGLLSIHGVERQRDLECSATQEGTDLRVLCSVTVVLSDQEIPIPKLMFMKIDEVMDLDLDFFLSPAKGGESR